jgi:hypothetical protein
VVVDGDVDSIGTKQVGSATKIDPAELKWKRKLPTVISSTSLKEEKAGHVAGECGL